MNILNEILNAQGGKVLQQMASQFGLEESDARGAVTSLLPAITEGMKRNASSSSAGLDSLLAAISKGQHSRYIDEPDLLGATGTRNEGNSILGHILGSKDVSRRMANQAASNTGIDAGILKQMLPVLASVAMGALSKQSSARPDSANLDGLTSFLDLDGDGSVADDLLNFAKKLM